MNADLPVRLRSLTQDYHEGRLTFPAYRSMRAALLDSLVSGAAGAVGVAGAAGVVSAAAAAAVAVTQPRSGSWQPQSDAITRPGKPRVAPGGLDAAAGLKTTPTAGLATGAASVSAARAAAASTASRSSASGSASGSGSGSGRLSGFAGAGSATEGKRAPPLGAIAIGVVILAIAGVGLWLWLGRAPSSADVSGGTPAATEQGRVHALMTQFTERGDWSDAPLATLNTDLLELGGARLSESAAEPWFTRFIDEVRQRLKEQQALSSTPLSADNSPLAALAVTVGLDLNAPDAAIHIAALPPPPRRPENEAPQQPGTKSGANSSAGHAAHSPAVGRDEPAPPAVTPLGAAGAAGAAGTSTLATSANEDSGAHTGAAASLGGVAAAGTRAGTRTGTDAGSPAGTRTGTDVGARASDARANVSPDTHEGACRIELVGTRRPFCQDVLPTAGAEGPPLALIPAGAFEMGSAAAAEEQPVHPVTIRAAFAISINEVSQGEFKQFCSQAERPCPKQPWSGDDYPVVNVSWDDARAYAAWLSSVTHHHYSLPSEAQWEYAARAGRTGLFPNGDALSPTDAHYSMLAKQTTAAPRTQKFNANAFRLLHTVGNVREWVEDTWAPNFAGAPGDGTAAASPSAQRVARGGSYADSAARLRLSLREGLPASTRDATTGFRIVRELP